jgi:SPOR domain
MTVLRSLFLLLLLANLGVLAVFSWIVDEPAARPAYDGPSITLLREVDPASLGASPASLPSVERERIAEPASAGESGSTESPANAGSRDAGNGAAGSSGAGSGAAANGGTETGEADGPGAGGGATEPPASVVLTGQPGGDLCISIGPFALPTEADTAREALNAAGFEPVATTRETEVWDGYWVFIEALENQAAAREIAADLAANGIADTQVIASSDRGTLLSIGVFSDISRAGAQAERVNRVGYEATIADSLRSTQTHWLDVVLTSEESIALDLLREPGRISRLEQRACDTGGDD